MFTVIFGKDSKCGTYFLNHTVIGKYASLEAAAKARVCSGDLVFWCGRIVQNKEWLFQWEKNKPDCYAMQAINNNMTVFKEV